MTNYKVAVVGAAGMVGNKVIEILEERKFPVEELIPLDVKENAGKTLDFAGKTYEFKELSEDAFDGVDFAFFAAGGSVSEKYAKLAVDKGAKVIDNSSFFRMDPDIGLVIPEVNPEDAKKSSLIANPNCSTIQSVLALKPIYDKYGIKRIVYNTYQAVSGSGVMGIADLENKTCDNYPYPIYKNTLPHIDDFTENGYTKEEMKMINETKKILGNDSLAITSTTVRVPIKNSHAISINLELEEDFDLDEVKSLLESYPGIVVKDDPASLAYPIQDNSNGNDDVYVGRIRRDFSIDKGLNIWCVADNIRKGAATNSVQIAELLI